MGAPSHCILIACIQVDPQQDGQTSQAIPFSDLDQFPEVDIAGLVAHAMILFDHQVLNLGAQADDPLHRDVSYRALVAQHTPQRKIDDPHRAWNQPVRMFDEGRIGHADTQFVVGELVVLIRLPARAQLRLIRLQHLSYFVRLACPDLHPDPMKPENRTNLIHFGNATRLSFFRHFNQYSIKAIIGKFF